MNKRAEIISRLQNEADKGTFNKAGKVFGIIPAIFMTILGGFFCGMPLMMLVSEYNDSDSSQWQSTPCVITSSSFSGSGNKPSINIAYDYHFSGQDYSSEVVSRKGNNFTSTLAAEQFHSKHEVGSNQECFVNPKNAYSAVLVRTGAKLDLAMTGFISIFVIAGLGVAIGGWVRFFRQFRSGSDAPPAPSRGKLKGFSGKIGLALFGLVFMLVGLGVTYGILVRPLMRQRASEAWKKVPATVTSSEVGEHSGDDSTTYSIDISYEYSYEGKSYSNDRYCFVSGSSSGRSAKQRVVSLYPVGREIEIFIDPLNPYDAVITRELTKDIWFGLIPIVFFVVGLSIFCFALFSTSSNNPGRKRRKKRQPGSDVQIGCKDNLVLRSGSSRIKKVLFIVFFALFWNGIVAGGFFAAFSDGDGTWGLKLFLSVFMLIGLGLIVAVVHQLLALKNPKIKLQFDRPDLALGDRVTAQLEIDGKMERVRSLSIILRGQESATYRCGTRSTTRTNSFHEDALIKMDLSAGMRLPPSLNISIPVDSMHSFKSGNNEIAWHIIIKGDIPKWPDISDEINLHIAPRRN